MQSATSKRSTNAQKLRIFRRCFSGRMDAYGTYDVERGCTWTMRTGVTDAVLLDHLRGRRSFGVFLLTGTTVRAAAIDFDHDDLGPVVDAVHQAKHYGVASYVERSKSKGYHLWVFFEHPVRAAKVRAFLRMVLDEIGVPATEVFPKQDRIDTEDQLGNFINAPLFGRLVAEGRTVFLDPEHGWTPYADQWSLLANVERVTAEALDELVEINGLEVEAGNASSFTSADVALGAAIHGLPPCAVRMLSDGVAENQRVACFRLAVHFHRLGIPEDIAIAALRAWAPRNRPRADKRTITDEEIVNQTLCAYSGRYRGYGCEDPMIARHCDGRCPVQQNRRRAAS